MLEGLEWKMIFHEISNCKEMMAILLLDKIDLKSKQLQEIEKDIIY